MLLNLLIILVIMLIFVLMIGLAMIITAFLFKSVDNLGKKVELKNTKHLIYIEAVYIVLLVISLVSIFINRNFSIIFNLLVCNVYIYLASIMTGARQKYKSTNSIFDKIVSSKIVRYIDKLFNSRFMNVLPSGAMILSLCLLIFSSPIILVKLFNWPESTYFVQIISIPVLTAMWTYFTTGDIVKFDMKDNRCTKTKIDFKFEFNPNKSIVGAKKILVYTGYLIFNIVKSYNDYLGCMEKINEESKLLLVVGTMMFVVFISIDRILKEFYEEAIKTKPVKE